jgi:hypothetical protein
MKREVAYLVLPGLGRLVAFFWHQIQPRTFLVGGMVDKVAQRQILLRILQFMLLIWRSTSGTCWFVYRPVGWREAAVQTDAVLPNRKRIKQVMSFHLMYVTDQTGCKIWRLCCMRQWPTVEICATAVPYMWLWSEHTISRINAAGLQYYIEVTYLIRASKCNAS